MSDNAKPFRKYFTIHAGDVGTEAYDDLYVQNLERSLATAQAELSETKDYCNAIWQLIAGNIPLCPDKSKAMLDKAIADGKALREKYKSETEKENEQLQARVKELEAEQEKLVWNLAGISTICCAGEPLDFDGEWARPALHDALKLAKRCVGLEAKLSEAEQQRDKAVADNVLMQLKVKELESKLMQESETADHYKGRAEDFGKKVKELDEQVKALALEIDNVTDDNDKLEEQFRWMRPIVECAERIAFNYKNELPNDLICAHDELEELLSNWKPKEAL